MRLRHSLVGAIVGGDRPSTLFRYNAGSNLGYQGFTFTRADASTCATYVDKNGVVQTVAANVLRDNHYVNGVRTTLLEGSRQNLGLRSGDVSNAQWGKGNVTVGAAATDPSGGSSAYNIYPTTTGANRSVFNTCTMTVAAWTVSVYAKANGLNWLALGKVDGTNTGVQWFNVATGALGTGPLASHTSGITSIGNGWYRCWIQTTAAAATQYLNCFVCDADNSLTATTSGTNGILFWGGQMELGAFPSSYIPTGAAAVTRAADSFSANFPYAPQAMTVYADLVVPAIAIDGTTNYTWVEVGATDTTNPLFLIRTDGGTLVPASQYRNVGTVTANGSGAITNGSRVEMRGVLRSTTATFVGQSIDGGAETVSADSPTDTLAAAWHQTNVVLGSFGTTQYGFAAFRSLKITAGVQSMDTMRTTTGTLYNYTPGDPATRTGGTFTRADASTCATYVDANGVVQTVGPNIIRDGHYVNGVRTTLLEGSRTNLVTRSDALNNAAWVKFGAPTVTDNAYQSGALNLSRYQGTPGTDGASRAITFTGDGTKCFAVYAKQQGAASGTTTWTLRDTTAPATRASLTITVAANGTMTGAVSPGTLLSTDSLGNGVYRFNVQVPSVIAANTNTLQFGLVGGTCTDVLIGAAQAEDAAFPSSYIPTGAAAVTRAADALSFPFLPVPQAMTVYAKMIDVGESAVGAATRTGAFGNVGATSAESFYFSTPNGKLSINHIAAAGSGASTQTAAVNAAYDTVEALGSLSAAGVPQLTYSFNGAAEVSPAAGTARALDAAWNATTVWLTGQSAAATTFYAFQKLVIASGVQSMSTMRAL